MKLFSVDLLRARNGENCARLFRLRQSWGNEKYNPAFSFDENQKFAWIEKMVLSKIVPDEY